MYYEKCISSAFQLHPILRKAYIICCPKAKIAIIFGTKLIDAFINLVIFPDLDTFLILNCKNERFNIFNGFT